MKLKLLVALLLLLGFGLSVGAQSLTDSEIFEDAPVLSISYKETAEEKLIVLRVSGKPGVACQLFWKQHITYPYVQANPVYVVDYFTIWEDGFWETESNNFLEVCPTGFLWVEAYTLEEARAIEALKTKSP